MSEGSFVMLLFLVLLQEKHWRVNYQNERHTDEDGCVTFIEHVDLGGEA